jgi:hypothetical protein
VAGGRIGSFASLGLCVGLWGLQMCQLCDGRISIFFVRWGKNKKHSVGQRVGLDAVFLQYGLYVFGHLSKWFVFVLMFKFWSVCRVVNGRPTIGYNVSAPDAVAAWELSFFYFRKKENRKIKS